MDVNAIIADIYDVSTSDQDWISLGKTLFEHLGADAGTLRLQGADGRSSNVFEPCETGSDPYTDYYLHIDPIRAALSKSPVFTLGREAVMTVEDVVDGDTYRRSEFYRDFARSNSREHMMIGLIGDNDHTIMSFFRGDKDFKAEERAEFARLLPHVKRGLQLRQKVHQSAVESRLAYAAFEAFPGNAVVVDRDCNVLFANARASRTLARLGAPVSLSMVAAGGRSRLGVNGREGARLRQMVQDAAYGGNGAALRVEFDAPDTDRVGQLALFISSLPGTGTSKLEGSPVLVVIHELSQPRGAAPSMFSDLFGLSAAEGAVAAALLGGQTAETVARARDVSLDTVRTQIRTVLRKTDAANLRDFERIGALLGAFAR
jgi:DNA-binding CsgD family transcriptional regulator